jgi:dolichol-phosphate mannosyltransferase
VAEARPRRLSAVIACYLDAQAIPLMYRRLSEVFSALAVDYEIIFVNDGSPDDTHSVLKALTERDDHVLAIEHSRNFGSQNAFLSGMELATGDAVVLLDGDLQDPPEVIPALYQKWREGSDVVYGRRSRREAPAIMTLAYRAFYRVFRGVSYVPVPLDAGDFSLMDRRVVDELLALPETDQFLRGLRAWVGFKQTGVDYVRPERVFGRSTHSRLKNLWWAKKALFSFSFLPIEVLGYAAAVMTALSFAAVVYQIVDSLRRPEVSHGISTLIVLVVFFGSLTLLAIAVLGEYLIRVFEEVKRRPRFIRKALWHGGRGLKSAAEVESFVGRRKAALRSTGAGAPEAAGARDL